MSVLHIFYLLMRILDQPLWLKSKKMFVLGHIETVLSVTCFFFLLLLFLFSFCDETVVMEFKRDFAIVTRTVCVSIWYHFRKCGEHVQMPRMQGFVKLLWVHRLVTISIVFCLCLRERDMKQKWGQCLMAVMIIHGIMNSQQFQNVIMLCCNKNPYDDCGENKSKVQFTLPWTELLGSHPGASPEVGARGWALGGQALAHGIWLGLAQRSYMGLLFCGTTTHRRGYRGSVTCGLNNS